MTTLRWLLAWVLVPLFLFPATSQAAQTISEFPITTADSTPSEVAAGADGKLWFTETSKNKIGRMSTGGSVTEWPTASGASAPQGITLGSDNNIWYTEPPKNKVVQTTPAGTMTEFPVTLGKPWDIVSGPGGDLWFSEQGGAAGIGRMTTAGVLTEYTAGISGVPAGITFGPDGNVWFTEPASDRIGRVTPAGTVTEWVLAAHSKPYDIAAGPDGNVWFTEQGNGGAIGRIVPSSGAITEFTTGLTAASNPAGIVAASDGHLYFTEMAADKLGSISTAGAITETVTPTASSAPDGMTVGPDGNVWFVESHNPAALARDTIKPEVANPATSGVSDTAAILASDVAAHGQPTQYWFDYGLTNAYGAQTPQKSAGSGDTAATFTSNVSGLAPNTMYHFRVVASNGAGTTYGADQTFTTAASPPPPPPPLAPTVANSITAKVTQTSADLQADVNPNGQLTTFYFEYGLDATYGNSTAGLSAGSALTTVGVLESLSNLTPGTTYHFHVVATNATGTTHGGDATFTTDPLLGGNAPLIVTPTSTNTTSTTTVATTTSGVDQAANTDPLTAALEDQATTRPATLQPAIGKAMVVEVSSGTVRVKLPGSPRWTALAGASSVPMGAVLDVTKGKITFDTALPGGAVQVAQLWGGRVTMRQASDGTVDIYLPGKSARCRSARAAGTSKKRKNGSKFVWVKDNHGRFRSHGKNSVATVRGTLWLTKETCAGTLTRVKQGKVAVRDLHRKRTILVSAGRSYLAKPR